MSRQFAELKVSALLVLVGGYLVLGYVFMLLRIPPTGFGVPLGELLLVVVLLGVDPRRVLSRMNSAVLLIPFLLWWAWGLGHLAVDTAGRGFWAFRDATQVIESLFLIGAFSLAADPRATQRLARWMQPIIILACLYGLLFVFGDQLVAISPTLSGASGQPVPILGTFANTGTIMLWAAFACLIAPAERPSSKILQTLVAAFLVAFALVVLQMRTTYLQLVAISVLLLMVRPRALGRLAIAVPVLLFLLLVIDAFNIQVAGRLTSQISLSFFWEHIQSIVGIGAKGQGGVADAAAGVPLRLHWWQQIYDRLTSDPATLLVGMGYGVPLTDFRGPGGVVVREPHNSMISVVARLGLIGILAWTWAQVELFRAGFRAYRDFRRKGFNEEARFALLIIAFAILTLVSCTGEDSLEKPYYTIPYYAFWGFLLRVAYRFRAESRAAEYRYTGGQAMGVPDPTPS